VTQNPALNGARGISLMIGGKGADNDTLDYRVYIVRRTYDGAGNDSGFVQEYFGGGTATLSTAAVPGGVAAFYSHPRFSFPVHVEN
jgi:hypothetical protein